MKHGLGRPHHLIVFGALLTTLLALSPSAWALITTNESGMDSVFSQASFGANPIDIRFNTPQTFVRPDLLSIDTVAQFATLFSLVPRGPAGPISMFFVDALSFCGGVINLNFIGCGFIGGNGFVVESGFAAGPLGTALNSHELGHNLGLDHVNPPPLT